MRRLLDWQLFVPAILITLAGLVTMNSFSGEGGFFTRQIIWIGAALVFFFAASHFDWRFLSRTKAVMSIYLACALLLGLLFVLGIVSHGAQSWFSLGALAVQPSDPAKIAVVLLLSKYFSRRHIEIANVKHVIVSAIYAGLLALLIALEPDFGGAVIVMAVWFGMVLVSGISKKHILAVIGIALIGLAVLWLGVFEPYQKARILTFLSPLSDIRGAGYNAYQSTIAVGSGQVLGKGVGLGSQSKLLFLPEYQTDFIFAAFAEEWGFVGTVLLLALAAALILRIVELSARAPDNFSAFFGLGLAILFGVEMLIHAGMNMGLLPVTGIVFPFMSYGGSHLLTEWLALGVFSSLSRRLQGVRTTGIE